MKQINSVDLQEIQNFNHMAWDWWNPEGSFKPLHQMNPVRLKFIQQTILQHFKRETGPFPFQDLDMLDVGCGGGLITEPLTRLGGHVTGIDAGADAVRIAKDHAAEQGLSVHYHHASVEEWAATGKKYDVVLALEIIEHVSDPALFLKATIDLIKPGGLLILSTLNRTLASWVLAIVGAEYVLRWLPKGTHQWEKFLRPSEIARILRSEHMTLLSVKGMSFDLLSQTWRLSEQTQVNYILSAVK